MCSHSSMIGALAFVIVQSAACQQRQLPTVLFATCGLSYSDPSIGRYGVQNHESQKTREQVRELPPRSDCVLCKPLRHSVSHSVQWY
jgi:hypothetical protein